MKITPATHRTLVDSAAIITCSLLAVGNAIAVPPPQIRTAFPVPDALRSAVQFWEEIFVRHARDTVVLHDREDMGVVWQVVELPKDETGAVIEAQVDDYLLTISDELRRRLKRLAFASPRDHEDHILLALAGGDESLIRGAWQRVRAQRGVADAFRDGLTRARELFPTLALILQEEGVPPEIVALPFVESMYNPLAHSSAGARGLWQLMPATARGLGLRVDGEHDERTDTERATRAAARILYKNYQMLGSWPLAITAYNHGPYGVRRAVRAVGTTDLVELIERYQKSTWGFASKNFYAEFLAAVHVLAHDDIGIAELAASSQSPDVGVQ